ncbi:hypothetical protein [Alteromonas gracilis]|uniref:hypothetical protein n=1 Tax=Alteromonas gracilis TaxID=1479524 RepID=UPI00321A59D4
MLDAVLALISATALLLGSPGPAPIALAAMALPMALVKGSLFCLAFWPGFHLLL